MGRPARHIKPPAAIEKAALPHYCRGVFIPGVLFYNSAMHFLEIPVGKQRGLGRGPEVKVDKGMAGSAGPWEQVLLPRPWGSYEEVRMLVAGVGGIDLNPGRTLPAGCRILPRRSDRPSLWASGNQDWSSWPLAASRTPPKANGRRPDSHRPGLGSRHPLRR